MIGFYTDNTLSQTVMKAVSKCGHTIMHIDQFDKVPHGPSIFYGILRGCGRAMHILKSKGIDYKYIDNGYFEAKYVDKNNVKEMTGKFRVVDNDMIEQFKGQLARYTYHSTTKNALVIPPSSYTANHYDTTPEDWKEFAVGLLRDRGYTVTVRDKSVKSPLEDYLKNCDLLLSFNSMANITALEMEIPSYDFQGIFRNAKELISNEFSPCMSFKQDAECVREYYKDKQFTLEELVI